MSGRVTDILMLRQRAGKTRPEVAADLGMSERHLLRLETGRQPISRVQAIAFAAYYGVDVDELEGVAA